MDRRRLQPYTGVVYDDGMGERTAKQLRRRDLPSAAALCTRAFRNAPHIVHFFPDETRRPGDAAALFRMRIRYGLLFGEAHGTSASLEGLAVWLPSERASMPMWREVLAGGMGLYRAVGSEAVARMTHVSEHNRRLRVQHVPEPHLFLSLLAVDPDHQGSGHGAALMRPMLERLDRDGVPCYAETTDEGVVAFYERLGFRAGEVSTVPGTDLTVWPLVREPAGDPSTPERKAP